MSNILVQVQVQGFSTVTILKASTGEIIVTLDKENPSQTFSLTDESNTVTICALSQDSATVTLEGVKDTTPIYVLGQETRDLDGNTPVTLNLKKTTRLTLQSGSSVSNGVKCGEVIIQPPIS